MQIALHFCTAQWNICDYFFHYRFSIDDKFRTVTDSNILTFENVSNEMTKPMFWKSRCKDSDKIIMTPKEIMELN